jgi:hypothetical protein
MAKKVRIFLGWSGSSSKRLAQALAENLHVVVPTAEPYFSEDVPAGPIWPAQLADGLKQADYGILCLTADNKESPWLNFEAGALWRADKKVCVLRLGVTRRQLRSPISMFVDKAYAQKAVRSICSEIAGLAQSRQGFQAKFRAAWTQINTAVGLQHRKGSPRPRKK